jgi:hypothetical protein
MISTSSSASYQGGPQSDSSRDSGIDYRDSGTSSPQLNENKGKLHLINGNIDFLTIKFLFKNLYLTEIATTASTTTFTKAKDVEYNVDSDSDDSVFSTSSSLEEEDSNMEIRDIYLGGSCMLRTHWRRDIAIPLLKSRNISFYLPTIHDNLMINEMKKSKEYKLQEMENSSSEAIMYSPRVLDSSRVLLFVITHETRSLAPMTLAAHYIDLAYNVVLCIQMLHDNCNIGSEKVILNLNK